MSESMASSDERGDAIEAKLDRLTDHQSDIMDALGVSLTAVNGTVVDLTTNLEIALVNQRESEANRKHESERNKRRFWVTIGGIILANVIVIVISIAVLLNQQEARELADARSQANRDRQSCATTLLVEWDARLGAALRVTTQLPPVDPASPEYRKAVDDLNQATVLVGDAKNLCYGPVPNPDPVPDR